MKIGIVTWTTYYNYGTALQNAAMQQVLSRFSNSVATISDSEIIASGSIKSSFIKRLARRLKSELKIGLKGIIKRFKSRAKQAELSQHFQSFYNQQINLDTRSRKDQYEYYDIIVCGSDQIWAPYPHVNNDYYSHFFLRDFSAKKIAYAPSIGALSDNPEVVNLVEPWLHDFSAISCREKSGAEFLSKTLGRKIPAVADPTLLLSGREWISMLNLSKTGQTQDYVVCYLLTYNPEYLKIAHNYAKQNNLQLKVIVTDSRFVCNKYICCYPSPQEFLNLILNADKVFTDSFHGSIFSILFNRNLTTFKRFKDNIANNQNQRIYNLFRRLDLLDRFVDSKTYKYQEAVKGIDYAPVDRRLDAFRQESLTFLSNAISAPGGACE